MNPKIKKHFKALIIVSILLIIPLLFSIPSQTNPICLITMVIYEFPIILQWDLMQGKTYI